MFKKKNQWTLKCAISKKRKTAVRAADPFMILKKCVKCLLAFQNVSSFFPQGQKCLHFSHLLVKVYKNILKYSNMCTC